MKTVLARTHKRLQALLGSEVSQIHRSRFSWLFPKGTWRKNRSTGLCAGMLWPEMWIRRLLMRVPLLPNSLCVCSHRHLRIRVWINIGINSGLFSALEASVMKCGRTREGTFVWWAPCRLVIAKDVVLENFLNKALNIFCVLQLSLWPLLDTL